MKSGVSEAVTESESQNTNVVVAGLRAWSANAIEEVIEFRGETTVVVARKNLRAVAERCRDDRALQFNLLSDATCVDRFPMEPRFELQHTPASIRAAPKVRIRRLLFGIPP